MDQGEASPDHWDRAYRSLSSYSTAPLRDDLNDEILQNRKVAHEFGMCIYFRKNLVKGILRGVLGHASIVRFTGC